MLIIAGKNNIAVHGLELALSIFPTDKIEALCNKTESENDGWQRSLKTAAKKIVLGK